MDFLTGTGLAASAGLNAYVPLLMLGMLDRYTQFVNLGPGFAWLSNGWILTILAVLLALEIIADKIPVLDSINDLLQTLVRPTSGGIVFGSTAVSNMVGFGLGGEETVTDPEAFVASGTWVPIVIGVIIALVIHGIKAISRPVVNTVSAGAAAPVVSTTENISSITLAFLAIFMPILALIALVLLVFASFWVMSKARRFKAHRAARRRPEIYP